jgi:hypothetical protein
MTDKTPFNDGNAGLRVVKMLEAASTSLKLRGELVYLSSPQDTAGPRPAMAIPASAEAAIEA